MHSAASKNCPLRPQESLPRQLISTNIKHIYPITAFDSPRTFG
jgi:hypothetical protein